MRAAIILFAAFGVVLGSASTISIEYWDSSDCSGPVVNSDSYPAEVCLPFNGTKGFMYTVGPEPGICAQVSLYNRNSSDQCGTLMRTFASSCSSCNDDPCEDSDDCCCECEAAAMRTGASRGCGMSAKFQCVPRDKKILVAKNCECCTSCKRDCATTTISVGECHESAFGYQYMRVDTFTKCAQSVTRFDYQNTTCMSTYQRTNYYNGACLKVTGDTSMKVRIEDGRPRH